jgi:hypothetical protein
MARMLDANQKFAGSEPKFSTELTQLDLSKTLSWYAQNKDSKDSQKYASDFFKKKFKLSISDVIKAKPPTFGFMCRIISNGGILSKKDQEWFDSEIEDIKNKISNQKTVDEKPVKTNAPNIQDRIREKASECVGELEALIDILIDSRFNESVSPYGVMHGMELKGVHTKYVIDWFKKIRNEYDSVMNTSDAEIKEGYSNFKKTDLKKLVVFCDQVIIDASKISGEAVKSRKPRKRKVKTVEQLTAKVKICQEFKELNLTSIDIKSIIGTMQLWVYNTKTRKLGVYHASDAGGLSIKGSSIQNYSEDKSIQKKLRKPEVTLPEILKGGKVYLRNAIDGVKAVAAPLSGRLNEDTILLRIVK